MRLNPNMSTKDAIVAMSEGNPGCMDALCALFSHDAMAADHHTATVGIFNFDRLAIYGPGIYVLWSDLCHRDLKRYLMLLKANISRVVVDDDFKALARGELALGNDDWLRIKQKLEELDADVAEMGESNE